MGCYEWQLASSGQEPDTTFVNNLLQFYNAPNPFKSSTTITFMTRDQERIKDYRLSIYNSRGQLVKRYTGKTDNFWIKTEITWKGKNTFGRKVAPGLYFYRLEYKENAVTRKMLLLR